ncbi:MAG TPA: CRTAC1 family protein [Gemmata sp.]|nr:CRTAC1 family protein [Gemmata sp.]
MQQPGSLDPKLNEFWVGNPWGIALAGHNLSSFERNRMYLNFGGKEFVEVSHLSGADSDGDGRAVVAADFRNSGMLDLIVRQVGGGPLLYFENRLPKSHYLTVTLRGNRSNRQGIGARLVAEVNGRKIVRELFPACSYRSQTPSQVHFGLAKDTKIDRLTIRWPSGLVQELTAIAGDRHVVIDESKDGPAAIETVVPGQTMKP